MPGGRPPKIKPDTRDAIALEIEMGLPKKFAAAKYGVPESTLYDYLKRGDRDLRNEKRSVYAEFSESVRKAEASLVESLLRSLADRPRGEWQAMAWKLERMFPRDFGAAVARQLPAESTGSPLETLAEAIAGLRDLEDLEELDDEVEVE